MDENINDDDEIGADYKIGEWAMMGYNNETRRATIGFSPMFEYVPIDKRLHLMQAWIDKLCTEYDHMVDQPGESDYGES
jgi:hypothetical protein